MKLICFSLFTAPCEPFERLSYIRGLYFNVRMNSLIFPDWRTHLEVDAKIYDEFEGLFDWLKNNCNLNLQVNKIEDVPLCTGMIWRMKPLFISDVTHILCRDADALTSYREALAVQQWVESPKHCHAMIDNRAHSGLMGGMVGFENSWFKGCMEVNNWEQMVHGWDFSQRGSDQNWLNAKVLPRIKDDLYWSGGPMGVKIPDIYSSEPLPQVEKRLWESNLIMQFIGSPGINEMEALRFFRSHDQYNWKYAEIEKQFPKLFWWQA